MLNYLQSAGAVVLTFGMVIFLHEMGHFLVCRWLGVRVEKFAFGFGPELLGVTAKSGTRFSICAFPLGGFVKPAGEELESATGRPDEYFSQNWKRRLAIVYAGPAMNYLLAFTLFTGVVYLKGLPEFTKDAIIGNLVIGHPAERAGIQIDDKILKVNGKEVASWQEMAKTIHGFPGQEIELTYQRGEKIEKMKLTPMKDEASGIGVIGIQPQHFFRSVGLGESAGYGVKQCWMLTSFTVKTIVSKLWRAERPDLAGPVGIVQMVTRAAHSSWEDLVSLIGLISVAIGFFNLLPVPLLDGGHGAMYLWEGLRGKPLTKESMAKANGVGIAFLLSLLVFATYNDVMRLRGNRSSRPAVEEKAP